MKKRMFAIPLFVVAVLSACSGSSEVEVGNKTTMEVNPVFDAGDVVKGEIIHASFKVKNTGNYPLVIGDVKGSCTCTVAEKPEDPIQPGEEGVIKAEVDTDRTQLGAIDKSVTFTSNTDPSLTTVKVKATVLPGK